ncbi:Sestrin 1-like protein [Cryptosporidium canis]|uniref:Sestrin 1-like protein n=1 Tax=Cryptosporidium canis TaxID=195482 RepID=A0ABQ8PBE7_9CRYT|nr:Sestrin 1-like protein [Cryptosporidium canis]KAJ1615294.1 Sestrin 1-like protein [Cryptosporidium canis]
MEGSPPISLLLVNYKDFVTDLLDITKWRRLKSNAIGKFVENKISTIKKQILLNGETNYWQYEQSLCILLRLSTCLNPYSDIREYISSSWKSIINELNCSWSAGLIGDDIAWRATESRNDRLFSAKIKDLHPDLLLRITLGGINITIKEAIKIFVSNHDKNQYCLPCGRFIYPEYLVPGTPGFPSANQRQSARNETFWKEVFNTFYGRIPSVFRIVYILPEYAKALLKSYRINMEDQDHGVLPLYYRHYIGILCSSLYDNDYMIKLEMQMFIFNDGPIEWLENPSSSLPTKFFKLYEFLKCITFEPAFISNEFMGQMIGRFSDTQVWTITEFCHILCIVTTIQSLSQLSCSFGITSMDHWELGPDPLEGVDCDGNTCYNPNTTFVKDCMEQRKTILSNTTDKNINFDTLTSYYREILSEYIDVSNEERNYTLRTKAKNSNLNSNSSISINKFNNLKLPNINLAELHNFPLIQKLSSFIGFKYSVEFSKNSLLPNNIHSKLETEGKDHLNSGGNSCKPDSQIIKSEYSHNHSQNNTENIINVGYIHEYNHRERDEYVSTLDRIKDLLNHFPPQGDILGISKEEISIFRSNSDKHKADRVLLSSVMNSKPKLKFQSLSTKFKRIHNSLSGRDQLSVSIGENENKLVIWRDKDTFGMNENKKEIAKKEFISENSVHITSMLNSFSIQMLEFEFYSETAWSILSVYSGECSKCIKDELDILLFSCDKDITTLCGIYKVPTTNPIRSSIWSYVFKLCGIVKFEMTELVHNSFLPLELKVLLKKMIRSPQSILRSDFERCRTVFSYKELIYYLIVICKAKQAVTIIYSIQSLSNILKDSR